LETLRFSVPGLHGGLAEAEGMARLDGDVLHFEYQTRDDIFGIMKSDLKDLQIPLGELTEASLELGWFKSEIVLRANSMKAFDGFPGHEAGEIRLRLARKDRPRAQSLVSSLRLRLSELALARLRPGGDRLEG
jgi:hypothetical protein